MKLWAMFKGAVYDNGTLVEEYDHGCSSDCPPAVILHSDHAAEIVRLREEVEAQADEIDSLRFEAERMLQALQANAGLLATLASPDDSIAKAVLDMARRVLAQPASLPEGK